MPGEPILLLFLTAFVAVITYHVGVSTVKKIQRTEKPETIAYLYVRAWALFLVLIPLAALAKAETMQAFPAACLWFFCVEFGTLCYAARTNPITKYHADDVSA
jgi:hypothetical protein